MSHEASIGIEPVGHEGGCPSHPDREAKQRGADFKMRNDLVFRQDRLRAVIDQETCEPALEPVIRKLELPIQKQLVTAGLSERR